MQRLGARERTTAGAEPVTRDANRPRQVRSKRRDDAVDGDALRLRRRRIMRLEVRIRRDAFFIRDVEVALVWGAGFVAALAGPRP